MKGNLEEILYLPFWLEFAQGIHHSKMPEKLCTQLLSTCKIRQMLPTGSWWSLQLSERAKDKSNYRLVAKSLTKNDINWWVALKYVVQFNRTLRKISTWGICLLHSMAIVLSWDWNKRYFIKLLSELAMFEMPSKTPFGVQAYILQIQVTTAIVEKTVRAFYSTITVVSTKAVVPTTEAPIT